MNAFVVAVASRETHAVHLPIKNEAIQHTTASVTDSRSGMSSRTKIHEEPVVAVGAHGVVSLG